MDFDQVVRALQKLQRAFQTHRHTGLDSAKLRLAEQIEATGELTAADMSGVGSTYGADEQGVIDNTRTRVNEIEAALKESGILK